MSDVEVSRDALGKVKSTLVRFRTDVSPIPAAMSRHIEMTEDACERAISRRKAQIEELACQIRNLESQLVRLHEEYAENERQIAEHERQIQELRFQQAAIESEQSALRQEYASLSGQAQAATEPETRDAIHAEMSSVMNQIEVKGWELENVSGDIIFHETQQRDLEEQNRIKQNEMLYTEAEIERQKKEQARQEAILEKMKASYGHLKDELSALRYTMDRFVGSALSTAEHHLAGVDQCIQHIEEYMATNL